MTETQNAIPSDATHRWLPARRNQREFYKFQDDNWYCWSNALQSWELSKNDSSWFTEEIIEGFFVKLTYEEITEDKDLSC
jgi:hypothetical protein